MVDKGVVLRDPEGYVQRKICIRSLPWKTSSKLSRQSTLVCWHAIVCKRNTILTTLRQLLLWRLLKIEISVLLTPNGIGLRMANSTLDFRIWKLRTLPDEKCHVVSIASKKKEPRTCLLSFHWNGRLLKWLNRNFATISAFSTIFKQKSTSINCLCVMNFSITNGVHCGAIPTCKGSLYPHLAQ